jgi:hypothetical protein
MTAPAWSRQQRQDAQAEIERLTKALDFGDILDEQEKVDTIMECLRARAREVSQ